MLCRFSRKTINLAAYRDIECHKKLDEVMEISASKEVDVSSLCPVCQGVLQKCDSEQVINDIVKQTKDANYEANDFKLNFSISALPSLNKLRYRFMAERDLDIKLEGYERAN